jgi:hypothetical protein
MSYTLDISKIFLDDKEYSKEIETELYQKLIDRRKLYLPYLYFQNILQKDEVCLVMKRLIEIYNNLYIDYMYDIYVNCFKVSYFYRKSDPGRCFYANYVSIDFDYMIDKVNLECNNNKKQLYSET